MPSRVSRIHLRQLVGIDVGDADVAGLALANSFIHAFKNLLCGCLVVPDVIDVEVNIVHTQMLQAQVDVVQHMLTATDALLDFLVRSWQEFCSHHHIVTLGHITQGTSDILFRCSQLIGDSCIIEIHAKVE